MNSFDSSGIATWNESLSSSEGDRTREENIATEGTRDPNPKWEDCLDALLGIWQDPSPCEDGNVVAPSQTAVEAAIKWLKVLQSAFPGNSPSLITAEPGGGIILEQHFELSNRDKLISEYTFYNNGRAEYTAYLNGRVVTLIDIPFHP